MTHRKEKQVSPLPKATDLKTWLDAQSRQDLLRFITCGSVDDGKSTLIGRLLWETRHILDDQLAELQTASKRHGTRGNDIDFALLVDGLIAEREQGITIDVAYRFFSTARRKFIVADTPGHEQYTRNMVTGASNSDLAIILVDASKGIVTQTRRHAYLINLMGIRQVILAINKIDLIGYRNDEFQRIESDFSTLSNSLELENVISIPLSALMGDNISSRSKNTPWYQGPTLIGCLETITVKKRPQNKTIFPVQWANRSSSAFRGLSGTLVSGELSLGDELLIAPSSQTAKLAQIITSDGNLARTDAGNALTLVLDREVDVSRGNILCLAHQSLEFTDHFEATLIWMHEDHGLVGRAYEIKLANQWANANITALKYRINVNNQAHESRTKLELNDIAVANISLSRPLVFEPYSDTQELGSFILVDKFNHNTVAAGIIRHNLRRSQNVHRQAFGITREDREKLNGHRGKVIWLTGLSGSGKSTIANALEKELHAEGKRTFILDGDNIRLGLSRDLGFTEADRVENIRRVAEVSKLMMDAGLIVITAFISPFSAERKMAKELIGQNDFIEVFVDAPLRVCEQRDPKGLYKRARSGEIPNMTGINSPYERPTNAVIHVETTQMTANQAAHKIREHLDMACPLKSGPT